MGLRVMSILSEKVLITSTDYLGPASKVFLERQTNAHMNGLKFDDLKKENIPELVRWIRISANLLIGKDRADEFADKVNKFA